MGGAAGGGKSDGVVAEGGGAIDGADDGASDGAVDEAAVGAAEGVAAAGA